MKTAYDVVIRPIITEQSMEDLDIKKYAFEVAKDANKIEIKKARRSSVSPLSRSPRSTSRARLSAPALTPWARPLPGKRPLLSSAPIPRTSSFLKAWHKED